MTAGAMFHLSPEVEKARIFARKMACLISSRVLSVHPERRLALSILCRAKKRKSKAFFFEKKKQKTFIFLGACWGKVRDSEQKFFGSFFQKRTSGFPYLIEYSSALSGRPLSALNFTWLALVVILLQSCAQPAPEGLPPPPPVSNRNAQLFAPGTQCPIEVPPKPDIASKPLTTITHGPAYPAVLQELGREGAGAVQCTIGVDGKLSRCAVIGWIGSDQFAESILAWVEASDLRFSPAIVNGRPITIEHCFKVNFRLQGPAKPALQIYKKSQ